MIFNDDINRFDPFTDKVEYHTIFFFENNLSEVNQTQGAAEIDSPSMALYRIQKLLKKDSRSAIDSSLHIHFKILLDILVELSRKQNIVLN